LLAQKTKTQRQVCIPSTGETYWACDNGVPQRFNVTLSRQVTPLMHEGDCALARATPHVSAPIDSPSKTTPAHKGSTTKHQEAEETVIREPHVATIMRECSLLISDCAVDSLDSYYMGGLSDPSAQHPTATCNNDECHDDMLPYENGIPTDFSRDFAYLEDLADISCVAISNEPSCWDAFMLHVDAPTHDAQTSVFFDTTNPACTSTTPSALIYALPFTHVHTVDDKAGVALAEVSRDGDMGRGVEWRCVEENLNDQSRKKARTTRI